MAPLRSPRRCGPKMTRRDSIGQRDRGLYPTPLTRAERVRLRRRCKRRSPNHLHDCVGGARAAQSTLGRHQEKKKEGGVIFLPYSVQTAYAKQTAPLRIGRENDCEIRPRTRWNIGSSSKLSSARIHATCVFGCIILILWCPCTVCNRTSGRLPPWYGCGPEPAQLFFFFDYDMRPRLREIGLRY